MSTRYICGPIQLIILPLPYYNNIYDLEFIKDQFQWIFSPFLPLVNNFLSYGNTLKRFTLNYIKGIKTINVMFEKIYDWIVQIYLVLIFLYDQYAMFSRYGLTPEEAGNRFYIIDEKGLITKAR